jgi:hypothetical protein
VLTRADTRCDRASYLLGYRFGLRAGARARKLLSTFTQEDLMATRRPTEPPRSTDLSKEIPNVLKADEKLAPKTPRSRAKSTTPRATTAAKPAATAAKASPTVSEDVRRGMIAEGAYLRAERRGFAAGHEEMDWLAAEAEVDALLKARAGGTHQ